MKRKLFVFFILLLMIAGVIFYIYKTFIERTPNCFDNIQNNAEDGVDCGGSCLEICRLRATKVNTLWAKTFNVAEGVANIAGLVENPNFDYNMSATYVIKTFDEKGIGIHDFRKRIQLAPGEKRVIFVPSVQTGKVSIAKTFLDFESIESLTIGSEKKIDLQVISKVINKDQSQTRLTVGIKNKGLSPKRNIEIVAVLYNEKGDVINVAKTFIEYFGKREERKVELTWQEIFDSKNIRVDVYLRQI